MRKKRRVLTDEEVTEVKELYDSGEFNMSQIASKFDVSITAVNTALRKANEDKKSESVSGNTTMNEFVKRNMMVDEHIREFLKDDASVIEVFNNIKGNRKVSNLVVAEEAVEGATFLHWHEDVDEFLKKIGCTLLSDENNNWLLYKRLIVRRLVIMYEKAIKTA